MAQGGAVVRIGNELLRCLRCHRLLPRAEFDRKPPRPNGTKNSLRPRCRECRNTIQARKWGGTVTDHFWRFVEKTPSCWLWTGLLNNRGYGDLMNRHKHYYAHRLSYEIAFGPIPDDMCVCHRCDNPRCVNPAHLFLGSNSANIADKVAKRRQRGPHLGEQHHNAKLTVPQVMAIRDRRATTGDTYAAIAADYGVSEATVIYIVQGKRWRHVPDPATG